jgi:PAS domain S-box-containing protein
MSNRFRRSASYDRASRVCDPRLMLNRGSSPRGLQLAARMSRGSGSGFPGDRPFRGVRGRCLPLHTFMKMSFDDLHRPIRSGMRRIQHREWWLWSSAFLIILLLSVGLISFLVPMLHSGRVEAGNLEIKPVARGLLGLVFLFDLYVVYQRLQISRIRRQLFEREELFRVITENAADMIAVVNNSGRRIYNSPAYQKVLGYNPEELSGTSPFEQIHPNDRKRVMGAAEKARRTGLGERLEYRIRHKDGSWRILESSANVIRNAEGGVKGLVVVNRDITDRKRAEETLAHNAVHDGLTDLPNRTLLLDRLGRALAHSRRHANFKFAVLFIDIDGFKVINDSLGHDSGNALLTQIARRLTACLRRVDTVSRPVRGEHDYPTFGETTLARPGGDKFVVLAEEVRNPSDAIRIAERIQERVAARPFDLDGRQIVVTASIGIAFSGNSSALPQDVLRDAEIAMYRAKTSGKARCEVFDNAMHTSALKRLQLESDLRQAVDGHEFRVYYQPIVSIRSGQIVGFEALSRWQRPEGIVNPCDFIPLAEETGILSEITRQLLPEAFQQLRTWQQAFPSNPPLSLSVNISPKQFAQEDLASEIGRLLQENGMDPRCIALEITETSTMACPARSAAVLSKLKALGVRLDIDDFGTGYSSLSRLQSFHVDTLKIDRLFVSRMDKDPESLEIVRIIIILAHTLGLNVIAEGVETRTQLELLRLAKCGLAQGYLFSKPADQQTVGDLLAANRSGKVPPKLANAASSSG